MLKSNKKIAVLTTGGTIAGVGEPGVDEGYKSGSIDVATVLGDYTNITYIEICNVNSDDITSAIWFELYNKINSVLDEYDGFVITHGTDTLEETALFLSMTLSINKPVVITGAMHPSTSSNPDGPVNFEHALQVVNQKDKGVWVAFGGKVLTGSECYKAATNRLDAFDSDGFNTDYTFAITTANLPNVGIVYFNVDADCKLLEYALGQYDGVVIAGAGVGEFSEKFINVIDSANKPIVVSSRINNTTVKEINLLTKKAIPAYRLNPQKAAVLLRIALCSDYDFNGLARLYNV